MFDRKVLITGTSDSSTAVMQNISYNIKDITDYRTRCRQFSCATAVEHRVLHRISLYKYGIVGVINRCQRMIHIDQHRMDSRLDSFRCISSHAKKFDHASHLVGIFDIRCRDFGDSFGIYIIKSHSGIESCTGEDRHFSSRIQTFHISGRIAFRISQILCQFQSIGKFHTVLAHLGQDKVSRTVHDTHNFRNMIACQTLFDRADDRDSAGHCCFMEKVFFVLCSGI